MGVFWVKLPLIWPNSDDECNQNYEIVWLTYLVSHHDSGLGSIVSLKHALGIATLAIRAPVGLLGVIGLEHVSTLHLKSDHQEGAWIGVRLASLSKFDVARHVEFLVIGESEL